MLSKTKAKEMRRRTSQRRATHRARRPEEAEAETRICAPHIMSPNGILKMSKTRFICARNSWHVDHRGEIRQRSTAVTFAMGCHAKLDPCLSREHTLRGFLLPGRGGLCPSLMTEWQLSGRWCSLFPRGNSATHDQIKASAGTYQEIRPKRARSIGARKRRGFVQRFGRGRFSSRLQSRPPAAQERSSSR